MNPGAQLMSSGASSAMTLSIPRREASRTERPKSTSDFFMAVDMQNIPLSHFLIGK